MPFTIPESELRFRTSRAGGPGGQHVNKAETRVEVLWDVARSSLLSEPERERVLRKLANRIDADGVLHVVADERRSFTQNRGAAVARLQALVDSARRAPKPRKPTRPSRAAREARLREKRRRSETKRTRDHSPWED
ncbi:MAG: aminoacyl-tRNA hydrolase [Gemmatimonadetes bacterium]|nr:aminoacyl-tRNA hydrolase [Gemmatimonadota bacterium]